MRNPPAMVLRAVEFFVPAAHIITDGEISSQVTFSRASIGTYFDINDRMVKVLTNDPRNHHVQNGSTDFGLLVEAAATNVCLQSEDISTTWTELNADGVFDVALALDNTHTADELVVDTTVTVPHAIEQTYTGSTTNDFCASVWVKQSSHTDMYLRLSDTADTDFIDIIVDLSAGSILQVATATGGNAAVTDGAIETHDDDWYRVWISGICDSTTTAHKIVVGISQGTTIIYTGNGADSIFIWGAQIEQASFPSSYIPTIASSATRAVEDVKVDLTAVPWFNVTEGTTFIDFKRDVNENSTSKLFQIDDGNFNDSIRAFMSPGSADFVDGKVTDAGVDQASFTQTITTDNARGKVAFAYKANDFSFSVNGATPSTDVSGTIPTGLINFRIGTDGGSQQLNGVIRDLRYYDTRLIDSTLVTLTT